MEYFTSMENIHWLIWLGVGVAFIIAELAVPAFIVIFFGAGALIAGATAFFGASIPTQLVVFGLSSLALILLFRKTMARVFTGDNAGDEEQTDTAVGQLAEVVEPVSPNKPGRIKFQGSFWTARCDTAVPAGSMVRILQRDKTAFLVEKEQ